MTVAAQTPTISYTENGLTTAFAVPFRYNQTTDLVVTRRAADGTETELVHGTDFTASSGNTDAGGTVTTTAPAASGTKLIITRETARQQTADYITSGAFSAESHERALDQAMMVAQEQDTVLARCVKAPVGEAGPMLAAAATLEGKTLFYEGGEIKAGETDLPALEAAVLAARDDTLAAQTAAEAAQAGAEAAETDAEAAAATATTKAGEAAASAASASTDAGTATTKAAEAAASAASAVLAPGTSATSTSAITIGTGVKSFTIQTGKAFVPGHYVLIAMQSNPVNLMFGIVTSYNSGTGLMAVEVSGINGSGTAAGWNVALSGPPGTLGTVDLATETTGTLDVDRGGTGAVSITSNRLLRGNGTSAFTASGIADFSDAEAIRIDSSENVGIGTTAPGAKLDVRGLIRSETSSQRIDLNHDGTNGSVNSTTALLLYGGGANAIIFHTDATARMRISATGDVGIGTASPSEKLHVAGNIRDSLGNVRRIIKSAETSGTLTAASANQRIRASGNITIPSGVFTAGDTVMIQNKSGGAITITQGSGLTLTDSEGNTGTRTLANHGVVTVVFDSASVADIFGAGLS